MEQCKSQQQDFYQRFDNLTNVMQGSFNQMITLLASQQSQQYPTIPPAAAPLQQQQADDEGGIITRSLDLLGQF